MTRIAVVHEWLTAYAGSERVLEQILNAYPAADVFAVCDFLEGEDRVFLGGRQVRTTFVQRLPGARRHYRNYLPLMPLAIEQLDLSGYDLVISSSHAVAKGVLTGPDQVHVSYVHSPIRYAWDLQHQYLRESGLEGGARSWLARWMLHRMRIWDVRTANGVDCFIANSGFIAKRIRKAYGRSAQIVYPPVDVAAFSLGCGSRDFYLTAARMVPYKRVELVVNAFNSMPEHRLVVIGDGPELDRIRDRAGPNVEILGYQPFEVLRDHMQRAKAFVFAAQEDFGIMPVEAQACGTPVIGYGSGGLRESIVVEGEEVRPTGILFAEQSVKAIRSAVARFEGSRDAFSAEACRRNAERFSPEMFRAHFSRVVSDALGAAARR